MYFVRDKKKGYLEEIATFIKNLYHKKSGIIYCLRKNEAEKISDYLNEKHDLKTGYYHGGVDNLYR